MLIATINIWINYSSGEFLKSLCDSNIPLTKTSQARRDEIQPSSNEIKCEKVGSYFLDKRMINYTSPWRRRSWHLPNDRSALYGTSYTFHLACIHGSWLWLTSCPLSHYHSQEYDGPAEEWPNGTYDGTMRCNGSLLRRVSICIHN